LARYVAKYKKYSINFQADVVEDYATGRSRTIIPLINLQFDVAGSLLPWEVEAALAHFKFDGLTTEMDEMTPISPLYRLSVFDSQQFVDANRGLKVVDDEGNVKPLTVAMIDEFLDGREEAGTDYLRVDAPQMVAPWPAYPKLVAGGRGNTTASVVEKIVAKVREDEYDPAEVIAYERQNLNRPDVIAALEELVVAAVDEPVVVA
jgi:hypothetical protein